jgi:hypothetical protein
MVKAPRRLDLKEIITPLVALAVLAALAVLTLAAN